MRGLGNKIKWRSVYQYLKDKNLDIIFLQETHASKKTVKIWQNEWGKNWLVSYGNSTCKGTAILINPKRGYDITRIQNDIDGRYTICNLTIDNVTYTLGNLYAPNNDSPEFFKKVLSLIEHQAVDHIIVGGDFNLTLKPEIDRLNSSYNNGKAAEFLLNYMNEHNLCDFWRHRNPECKNSPVTG